MSEEYVVLVNERNEPVGKALKAKVHTGDTPLHRGFSVYLFDSRGNLLLQQRSRHKHTWPLVWSNSCCGHPGPGEGAADAAKRRLQEELGLHVSRLWAVLPDFRYRAELDGIVENEFCPVFAGFTDEEPVLNPKEVEAVQWVPWDSFRRAAAEHPDSYSPWCVQQVALLEQSRQLQQLFRIHIS